MNSSLRTMKPLFCFDITEDKNNNILNGSEFITRTAPKQEVEAYENKQNELEKTIEKSQIPTWLLKARLCIGFGFLLLVFLCVKTFISTREVLLRAAIGGAIAGILWLILHFALRAKRTKVEREESPMLQLEKIEADFKKIHSEMGVPEDAEKVDILIFKYKTKNGEICPKTAALQLSAYANAEVAMYATDDEIHIADLENVYSFKKFEARGIITVNKRISVPFWNKDVQHNEGKYKQYNIRENNMSLMFFKPYHILRVERDGQRYGIYFPCYELEVFERLTGLRAER